MYALFLTLLATLLLSPVALAESSNPDFSEEVDHFGVRYDRVEWPSPDVLASDLRSNDDKRRLTALNLIGLTDREAHHDVWTSGEVTGQRVVIPDQIEVTYAALGENTTRQAIVAMMVPKKQMIFVAVATPTAKGWTRIAAFDGSTNDLDVWGKDILSAFIQYHPVIDMLKEPPVHFELVLHPHGGGGGTRTWSETEARFRIREGVLHRVLSFESRKLTCPPDDSDDTCTLEKRWFMPDFPRRDGRGGFLIETSGQFKIPESEHAQWVIEDLENRHLKGLICIPFKWNDESFSYERRPPISGEVDLCGTHKDPE